MALIVEQPARIVTPRPGDHRGRGLGGLETLTGVSVLCRDGRIERIAPLDDLLRNAPDAKRYNAAGKTLIPGLVDCHSHPVFGGDRTDEFAKRTAGASYEEIAASGGGIARTVAATQQASKDELKQQARKRLDRALSHGVTTLEAKSGYGLTPESELKMLEVIRELDAEHPVDLVPTFLGAHAVPKGMNKADYLASMHDLLPEAAKLARFCDVFCEQGYFSPGESVSLLEAARENGMLPKMHADQFHSIGCLEAAVELGAVSVDHLEAMRPEDAAMMADTDIVCVALPGVSLFLDIPYVPARALIDAGCAVAVATDFNPGSNMTMNLPLMMSLLCMKTGVSTAEALIMATRGGAAALRLTDRGCIAEGMRADMAVLDADKYEELVYFYGERHVTAVIKGGKVHEQR
ncbi:imidazolonepropionase [Salidesulfovibrio brasiliensis]